MQLKINTVNMNQTREHAPELIDKLSEHEPNKRLNPCMQPKISTVNTN